MASKGSKKSKTVYKCTECGETSLRWMGQCSHCQAWNSLEEVTLREEAPSLKKKTSSAAAQASNIEATKPVPRLKTGIAELDNLLGGGIMPASMILLGGEPGVGKSTLLLAIAKEGLDILYISGEESIEQIAARAKRVGALTKTLKVVHETDIESIVDLLEKEKPNLVFIDSIQTIHTGKGFAGSVAQVRDSAALLLEHCKTHNVPIILTGHITKEGQLAGPKQLEHAVDVVLYFESERDGRYRIIRSIKNRFGATGEVAILEMTNEGIKEADKKGSLLHLEEIGGIGSVLFPQIEGSRVMALEIQVLVTPTGFANGRRIGEHIDASRIHIVAAILEKYLEFRLSQCDIFVKVNGGTSLRDRAADLALLVAMASSYLDRPVNKNYAIAGEVSLTGQVRTPSHILEREKAMVALANKLCLWGGRGEKYQGAKGVEAIFFAELEPMLTHLFGSLRNN